MLGRAVGVWVQGHGVAAKEGLGCWSARGLDADRRAN